MKRVFLLCALTPLLLAGATRTVPGSLPCEVVRLEGLADSAETTTTGDSGVPYVLDFADVALGLTLDDHWVKGTTAHFEMCYEPDDAATRNYECELDASFSINTGPINARVGLGQKAGTHVDTDAFITRKAGWGYHAVNDAWEGYSQSYYVNMVDGDCLALLVTQLGTSRVFSALNAVLSCHQIGTCL